MAEPISQQGLYQDGNSIFENVHILGSLEVSGIVTSTTTITASKFIGDGSELSGIDASTIKDPTGTTQIQGTTTGATHSGRAVFNELEVESKLYDGDGNFGSSGQVLSSDGTDTAWVNTGSLTAGAAAEVGVTAVNVDSDHFITFVDSSSGNENIKVDADLKYNPSTNTLASINIASAVIKGDLQIDGQLKDGDGNFGGSGTVLTSDGNDTKWDNVGNLAAGSAAKVSVSEDDTETDGRLLFSNTAGQSGGNVVKSDNDLTYNANTNTLSVANLSGTSTQAANLSNHDTDDLSEGSSNLYFTSSRSRGAISVTSAGTPSGAGSLSYDSGTGQLTFTPAAAAGEPTTIAVLDESSDTECFPLFGTNATGSVAPKTGSNLKFNSDDGTLTATKFSGQADLSIITLNGTCQFSNDSAIPFNFFKTSSGANNGVCALFRNDNANHSWGIVSESRTEGSGSDRPSILFSSSRTSITNQTWTVGFGYTDDHFRIRSNHGHRNGGWGTTRFSIHTDGTLRAGEPVGGSTGAVIIDTSNANTQLSQFLRSDADDTFSGKLSNSSRNEAPEAGRGCINLKPSASGGRTGIIFDSFVNNTSDHGYIWWYDDNNNYAINSSSSENGAFVIGVQNDYSGASSSDSVAIESAGDIFLNPGLDDNSYGGASGPNFSRGKVYVGRAASRNEVYHTGNLPTIPTNNNELINGAGYITSFTDTNTTYSLSATGGANPSLKLDGTSGTDTSVQLRGTGSAGVNRNSNTQITIDVPVPASVNSMRSSDVQTNSESYQTAISVTINPTATNSVLMITGAGGMANYFQDDHDDPEVNQCEVKLFRGGSEIGSSMVSSSARPAFSSGFNITGFCLKIRDTSTHNGNNVTYHLKFRRFGNNGNGFVKIRPGSSLTVEEII